MKACVIVFPGSNCDLDAQHALSSVAGFETDLRWHRDADLSGYDLIVLPGGFSYGDHLRAGAIARFAPAMRAVARESEKGTPILGICNGFQILLEAGLLPGVMLRNDSLQFRHQWVSLRVERTDTAFTRSMKVGDVLRMPIAHGEGNYFADTATGQRLEAEGRVVFRYSDQQGRVTPAANPNGSMGNIAGIVNERGNVLGMMPHPERASEPLMGGADGLVLWRSVIEAGVAAVAG